MTATIREIKPQEFVIRYDGHTLRQHYFTRPAAEYAAAQLGVMR